MLPNTQSRTWKNPLEFEISTYQLIQFMKHKLTAFELYINEECDFRQWNSNLKSKSCDFKRCLTLAYTLCGSVAEPRRARGLPLVLSAGPMAMMSVASAAAAAAAAERLLLRGQ